MSLKKQMIVWSVFICSLIMLASNLFNYFNSISIMQEQIEEDILGSMKQAEYNIETLAGEVDKISKIMGTGSEFYFASGEAEKQNPDYVNHVNHAFSIIENYLIHYDYLDGIFVRNLYDEWVGCDMKYTKLSEYNSDSADFNLKGNYEKIKKNYPKLTLIGSYNTTDFISQSEPKQVLTFARLIPRTASSEEYIMYINVKEDMLSALYGSGADNSTENFFLLDSDRMILSGTDKEFISRKLPYAEDISDSSKWGKFRIKRSGESRQVFYYQLEEMRLTLIREVSLSFMNSSVNSITKNLVVMLLISSGIIILLYSSLMNKIISPLYELIKAMKEAGTHPGEKEIEYKAQNEVGYLIGQFNTMNREIGQLIQYKIEDEGRKRDLEIELMQAQINPHFLYNTMNMIKWMAKLQGADNIVESIVALSGMLKPAFSDSRRVYSIREELEYLNHYITIMNYRYGNHIRFTVQMEEGIEVYQILKFSLQPIVENAFIHGFSQEGANGEIQLTIQKKESDIEFSIRDSGRGISKERLNEVNSYMEKDYIREKKKGHVGLGNIHMRLKLTFGENYGLKIDSDGNSFTTVYMVIPQILAGGESSPQLENLSE